MDWKTIIYQYSLQLTRNRWDAEDLTQEAWLKLMNAIEQKPERTISKAYLYRVPLENNIGKHQTPPASMMQGGVWCFRHSSRAAYDLNTVSGL
ncbi:RNA polymerase sigma factor [Paenibacillus senegalensis]|uniref:RNA polymerase sigma factor n=1 Tax=Paenibacillus senegalensis TaxID=1465766 RepID=UPI000289ED87|nr:sigma factor [Paenibacillus senegalensis]